MGPWHLVGQIDKDQRTSCQHPSRRDQGQVKRRPETLKCDRELYDAMNCVPWLIGPVTRQEAGWETTPGCSKPFNHTAE